MSRMEIEPPPSNIGDKLVWPRAHTTSDPLSYRPGLLTGHRMTLTWSLQRPCMIIHQGHVSNMYHSLSQVLTPSRFTMCQTMLTWAQ